MSAIEIYDQLVSWACVIACWWIIHQTAQPIWSSPPVFLMRAGVFFFGSALAVITVVRLFGGEPWLVGQVLKTAIFSLLLGVILFHKNRFQKL